MDFIKTLVKLFSSKPTWIIDVDQIEHFDDDGNSTKKYISYKVRRWSKIGLYYSDIADFDTLSEAHEFVSKYKSFPLNADGVY
jgi:hypothetical protein